MAPPILRYESETMALMPLQKKRTEVLEMELLRLFAPVVT
jgi:hypothetical protein